MAGTGPGAWVICWTGKDCIAAPSLFEQTAAKILSFGIDERSEGGGEIAFLGSLLAE